MVASKTASIITGVVLLSIGLFGTLFSSSSSIFFGVLAVSIFLIIYGLAVDEATIYHATTPPQVVLCPDCGARLGPGGIYCQSCGERVIEDRENMEGKG